MTMTKLQGIRRRRRTTTANKARRVSAAGVFVVVVYFKVCVRDRVAEIFRYAPFSKSRFVQISWSGRDWYRADQVVRGIKRGQVRWQ
jgi:hypothetical protein